MLSTVKSALVLVLACSALAACGGAGPGRANTSNSSDTFQERAALRRDVADVHSFDTFPERAALRRDVADAPRSRGF